MLIPFEPLFVNHERELAQLNALLVALDRDVDIVVRPAWARPRAQCI